MSSPTSLPIRKRRADMRHELASLTSGRPPFLSVYLDITPGPVRDGAAQRLSELLGTLEPMTAAQRSALAPDLAAGLDQLVGLHDSDATLAILVDADGRRFTTAFPHPPRWDVVELANLPYLGPMLYAEQALVHHVVALFRAGTDLLEVMTVPRHGEPATATYPLPEDAADIAPFVQRICRLSRTTLLILGAPAKELDAIGDTIEAGVGVETTLARVALDDLSPDELAAAIVRLSANHAANRTVELLRLWRFHRSQGEAATGLVDTVDALSVGKVALLLVHDEPGDERHAWFGSEPTRIAVDLEQAAPVEGGERLLQARLTDVVIRAALLNGCPVHIVPTVEETLDDGMGVILAHRATSRSLTELLEM